MADLPLFSELDAAGRNEYWASLALNHCKGLGILSRVRLLQAFGSAFDALRQKAFWLREGISRRQLAELNTGSWRATAKEEWLRASKINPALLLWNDPLYPRQLRDLPDAPTMLYAFGDASLLASPMFAIVGSRKATPHGCSVARYMARCLSSCGIAVVSGMARGIDSVAHSAAAGQLGGSIGVLGTGIDMVYPASAEKLFTRMREKGLLLSEFAPGSPPLARHFPIRNRIISGLSLGVLVVEATRRSGSLITARLALEQNREVYAVPGQALDSHCHGCQDLVRQGAHPVFTAEDILRDLAPLLRGFKLSIPENFDDFVPPAGKPASDAPATPRQTRSGGGEAAASRAAAAPPADYKGRRVWECLAQHGVLQIDALSSMLGIQPEALSVLLLSLELAGHIRRLPGARYAVAGVHAS